MGTTEIRKIAGLCKSEFVNKAYVGKRARGAVRVIRRTELPIRYAGAGIATGDTVTAGGPCPSHRIAYGNVDCGRVECKGATRCHRYVDNRASCRSDTVYRWLAILVENLDSMAGAHRLVRGDKTFVASLSLRQKYNRKCRAEPKSQSQYCAKSFHILCSCSVRQRFWISCGTETHLTPYGSVSGYCTEASKKSKQNV